MSNPVLITTSACNRQNRMYLVKVLETAFVRLPKPLRKVAVARLNNVPAIKVRKYLLKTLAEISITLLLRNLAVTVTDIVF